MHINGFHVILDVARVSNMQFTPLNDSQWDYIKRHITYPMGSDEKELRQAINGLFYVMIQGGSWQSLPESLGSPESIMARFGELSENGVWEVILEAMEDPSNEAKNTSWAEALNAELSTIDEHLACIPEAELFSCEEIKDLLQKIPNFGSLLHRQVLHIAFIGTFKSGKSTLINALIGRDILPTKANRATGVITEIVNSPELQAFIVRFRKMMII